MITTTLNRIRAYAPCESGWRKLLKHLGKTQADDEPLRFATIVESNGLADAVWCTRAEPQHASEWRLYAVRCARRVQHLMTDERSIAALNVAERHAYGRATDEELASAFVAASAAEVAAFDARDAATVAATVAATFSALVDATVAVWAVWSALPEREASGAWATSGAAELPAALVDDWSADDDAKADFLSLVNGAAS